MSTEFRKWYHENVCSWSDGPLCACDCATASLEGNVWFQEHEPKMWQAATARAVERLRERAETLLRKRTEDETEAWKQCAEIDALNKAAADLEES